jgi:hypothetical protein
VLRYLIAYAETVLRCAEYIHQIRWNWTGTYTSAAIILPNFHYPC